jgi:hypothetical protein
MSEISKQDLAKFCKYPMFIRNVSSAKIEAFELLSDARERRN